MSPLFRYRLSQVIVAVTVPLMCYVFSQMIPAGLSGDTAVAKKWFAASMVTVIAGSTAYLFAAYYRSNSQNLQDKHVVEVFSVAATEATHTKHARIYHHPRTAPAHDKSTNPPK